MKRQRLNDIPEWEGVIKGWAVNFATRNIWRCECEIDDLVQDACEKYLICKDRYPHVTAANFMALFKRCFINHIHDLSCHKTKKAKVINKQLAEHIEFQVLAELNGGVEDDMLEVKLLRSPKPLRDVIIAIAEGNCSRNEHLMCGGFKLRETHNEYFNRIINSDDDIDIVSMLAENI